MRAKTRKDRPAQQYIGALVGAVTLTNARLVRRAKLR